MDVAFGKIEKYQTSNTKKYSEEFIVFINELRKRVYVPVPEFMRIKVTIPEITITGGTYNTADGSTSVTIPDKTIEEFELEIDPSEYEGSFVLIGNPKGVKSAIIALWGGEQSGYCSTS